MVVLLGVADMVEAMDRVSMVEAVFPVVAKEVVVMELGIPHPCRRSTQSTRSGWQQATLKRLTGGDRTTPGCSYSHRMCFQMDQQTLQCPRMLCAFDSHRLMSTRTVPQNRRGTEPLWSCTQHAY